MSEISNEIIQKFSGIQNQIWQTASTTMSEAAGFAINASNPETTEVAPGELYTEMSEAKLVIQFAFSDSPESPQIILIDSGPFVAIATAILDEKIEEVTDATVNAARSTLEGLVQGICMAVGNMRNSAIIAAGLSIRFQVFSCPPNLMTADKLVKTSLTCSGDSISGNMSWIVDADTVLTILGLESSDVESPSAGGDAKGSRQVDDSLDILMDIPLQISVELGRMTMIVKDVIELGSGSIIEIDKAAGEPVDVMVNGKTVARGEVVVIEDNFGVRITEILNQQDRLTKLKEAA